jgi:hypothetical protein
VNGCQKCRRPGYKPRGPRGPASGKRSEGGQHSNL